MAERERLTVAEMAREVARPQVNAAGHRAVLPDPTIYQAVRKQVATDMVAGFLDDYGGVILATSITPLKPLPGAYFKKALAPYPGGAADPDFLLAHIAAEETSETSWDPGACITREGWAAWLGKQQYPWPKSLGPEPTSALTTPVGEPMPAPAHDAGTGSSDVEPQSKRGKPRGPYWKHLIRLLQKWEEDVPGAFYENGREKSVSRLMRGVKSRWDKNWPPLPKKTAPRAAIAEALKLIGRTAN
jgi:hypothetical protein